MPQGPDSASTQAVFIVDDDAGVRRALTRLFRSDGLNAEGFASPLEFLERLPTLGSGCVVLDLNMPEMSGTELYDLMRERGIALPVVFLTAHGDVPTGVTSMKKGAADFLEKPVDDEVLLKTVRDAIARHAADSVMRQARQTTLERLSRLSSREREVLHHVIGGRLNKQIAADLDISLKTVKVHRARVMEKMEYDSLAELARACESAGIKPQSEGARRISRAEAAPPDAG